MKTLPVVRKGVVIGHAIFCPACKHAHVFNQDLPGYTGPKWAFDGNIEHPTFSPSMHVFTTIPPSTQHITVCHSFVRNGRIEFLSDCGHMMKGTTVDLPDFPEHYQI